MLGDHGMRGELVVYRYPNARRIPWFHEFGDSRQFSMISGTPVL
jgi:hypothetical protein